MENVTNNGRGRPGYSRNRNGASNTSNDASSTRNVPFTHRNAGSRGNRQKYSNEEEKNVRDESSTRRYHSASRVQNHRDNSFADRQDRYRSRRDPRIGFKYLESLLEQPIEEILTKLNSNQGFFDLLQKALEPDFVVLIVKLIGKLCDCELSLRNQVLKKSLNITFLSCVQLYITGLAFQSETQRKRNSYFWRDPDSFWNNLARAFKTALRVMPQFYCEALATILKCTLLNIPQIEAGHKIHISDGIKNEFQKLVDLVETLISEITNKEPKDTARSVYEGEPPDNFRDISVYPTTRELIEKEKPFLRKNVVKGPYKDVEHYLDVQFRLLREDFVRPLREGIQSFLTNTKARIQNVKVHKRVQFLRPVTVTEHFCALLKFDFTNRQISKKYSDSRRFMFGSLVCFTPDDFKSLIFGRIADRNEKYMKNGELVIGFDENEKVVYGKDYVMIECSVYFEPYFHVLTVLKTINEEDFPMINYIIEVDTTSVLPKYITHHTIFNICQGSSIIGWQPCHAIENQFFDFNPSQNKAFVAALTRKFSIIQGPPGTGKTFVGLKIAKTLLENLKEWYRRTPMLVICYTNHALDQFLEGLIDTTDEIVRIGGQSKNENLTKFNLRNQSRRMSHNLFETKSNVTRLLSKIKAITDQMSMITEYDCVFDIKDLKEVIPHFEKSWFTSAKKEDILKWLIEMYDNNQHRTVIAEKFQNLQIREIDSESEEDCNEDMLMEGPMEDLFSSTIALETMKPLLSLNQLHQKIQTNQKHLIEMEYELDSGNYDVIFCYSNLTLETDNLHSIYEYTRMKLDSRKLGPIKPININVIHSQYIPRDDRWNLYFHWINLYYASLLRKHELLNYQFREAYKVYNESKDLENIKLLKNMKVIGMTTTGAARLHSSLQMIRSPIIIVEEAAEVLEAHIVTSLTKDCEQLILIGDHQQLKPSTSCYQIEKFYDLGISLFERMILNEVQCFTLNVQHRMRPEISSLIKPAIYPNLKDHESVFNRPKIIGIDRVLYFIDHKHPEESNSDDTTKKNIHEVKFLIQLARYLILNGYKAGEITILAAYLGQMYELQKERSKDQYFLKDVKITVLDNYQGEECDIILLSLVRNNSESKIGFLSIDNRVCVALSRARNGLYVMGNINQLSQHSELWVHIKNSFSQQEALGSSLPLKCQNHGKITMVSTADDFSSVVEGGCDQVCGMLLACQHNCRRLCHSLDREHKDSKCQEPCNQILCDVDVSHICQKKCYEECGPCNYFVNKTLRCNHEAHIPCSVDIDEHNCLSEVHVTLPCGHETDKPCYVDRDKYRCPFPCDTRLECGHSCVRTCHALNDPDHLKYKCIKPCGKPRLECNNPELEGHTCPKLCSDECIRCNIIVRKIRTKCSHQFDIECYKNVDEIECLKPCNKILACRHKCKDLCGNPCGPCTRKVKKVIPGCNHTTTLPCHKEPNRLQCSGKCPRILSCGHVCERRCNEECDPFKCKQIVPVSIRAKCGHVVEQVPCAMSNIYQTKGSDAVDLKSYCTFPCKEILDCGPKNKHSCSGSCGTCFQGRIHERCTEKCGQILICNHECEISCRETCKPCRKPCPYKCRHSACKKKCGEPCSKCMEPCVRNCEHQKCRKRCGDICNSPPCKMACKKKLKKCGHPCVGFCGDPCPPLCRICDKDVLEEIFFGMEDDENARFVLLTDCGHVIESEGMESWLEQDKNEIKFKTCPKCKTTICTTERYSDHVKLAVMDILKVKVRQYGTKAEIIVKRATLKKNILQLGSKLKNESPVLFQCRQILQEYLLILGARLGETNMKGCVQTVNIVELNSVEIKYQLIEQVYNLMNKKMFIGLDDKSITDIKKQVKFILSNLLRNTDDITKTEIENIQGETLRLQRIIEFCVIRRKSQTDLYLGRTDIAENVKEVSTLIFSLSKYQNTTDLKIKEHLTNISKLMPFSLNVTEAEKRDIVKAIGLAQGHWFKCPNGHPYAIGECGGAMQISKCIECGVEIGGTHHNLLSTNALAPEMDGARHGRWSNAANMANYDLQNIL